MPIPINMKKSGILAASAAAAASVTAFSASSSSSSSSSFLYNSNTKFPHQEETNYAENSSSERTSSDKFAPKLDGLRFIETLVTAHR